MEHKGLLIKLLKAIDRSESHNMSDIAEEINVTSELLELMIQELESMGYLIREHEACAPMCESCELKPSCPPQMKLWTLTELGQSLLKESGK